MRDDPLTFAVTSGQSPNTRIYRLQGPLTLSNIFDLQTALSGATQGVTVLDLTDTPYMDSTGLGAILTFYVSAKRRGCLIQLVGVNHRIAQMLELTKADTLIETYPSIEAAERDIV
jgi:anti-anti-sigma factor